jgi:hypothetical protein
LPVSYVVRWFRCSSVALLRRICSLVYRRLARNNKTPMIATIIATRLVTQTIQNSQLIRFLGKHRLIRRQEAYTSRGEGKRKVNQKKIPI